MPKAAAEATPPDHRLPVEPRHPAPSVDGRDLERPRARSCSPSRCLSLRLGFSDESNFASDTTTRKAYDLLVEGFGPGFNGPLLLVAEVPEGADVEALSTAVTEAVSADPGVAFVSPGQPNDPNNPTAVRVERRPHHRPAGRVDHRARQPAPRRRAAAGRGGQAGVDVARHRQRGRERRLLELPRRAHAVLLRRGAHRCRSCC